MRRAVLILSDGAGCRDGGGHRAGSLVLGHVRHLPAEPRREDSTGAVDADHVTVHFRPPPSTCMSHHTAPGPCRRNKWCRSPVTWAGRGRSRCRGGRPIRPGRSVGRWRRGGAFGGSTPARQISSGLFGRGGTSARRFSTLRSEAAVRQQC